MLRASSSGDTLSSLSGAAPEQQMLTPQEISDRRKARRLLDRKGTALEEAVERRVCQRVYNRIWRHRATLDEVRDEKLRSRTAALALVILIFVIIMFLLNVLLIRNYHSRSVSDCKI